MVLSRVGMEQMLEKCARIRKPVMSYTLFMAGKGALVLLALPRSCVGSRECASGSCLRRDSCFCI